VSQTKYCWSLKVKVFASQKFWAGYATAYNRAIEKLNEPYFFTFSAVSLGKKHFTWNCTRKLCYFYYS